MMGQGGTSRGWVGLGIFVPKVSLVVSPDSSSKTLITFLPLSVPGQVANVHLESFVWGVAC
jgi:hypothetical protein